MNKIETTLIATYKALYNDDPLVFRSPGRINLIGEHVDYNNGIVLPAAIDRYIYIALQNREDDQVHLYSFDYEESFQCLITDLKPSNTLWVNYILGVVDQFQKSGNSIHGFNIVFSGNIPQGAGLSSSAALACATAFGLHTTNKTRYSRMELAKIAQSAEHDFVGVNCGLMDQFASLFGQEDFLMEFDCQSLAYRYISFDLKEYDLVLFDSQVKHSLASSAYNERRQECEAGTALIAAHHPEVTSLRQVTREMLMKYVEKQEPLIFRRCNFVVNEIQRVKNAVICIQNNDFKSLGQLMYASHRGLSSDYDVSCRELDFLVDQVRPNDAVLGARMMGGGFGGCTINLIRKDQTERIIDQVSRAYKSEFGPDLPTYKLKFGRGTEQISTHFFL